MSCLILSRVLLPQVGQCIHSALSMQLKPYSPSILIVFLYDTFQIYARGKLGLTQNEIADAADIDVRTVLNIENYSDSIAGISPRPYPHTLLFLFYLRRSGSVSTERIFDCRSFLRLHNGIALRLCVWLFDDLLFCPINQNLLRCYTFSLTMIKWKAPKTNAAMTNAGWRSKMPFTKNRTGGRIASP